MTTTMIMMIMMIMMKTTTTTTMMLMIMMMFLRPTHCPTLGWLQETQKMMLFLGGSFLSCKIGSNGIGLASRSATCGAHAWIAKRICLDAPARNSGALRSHFEGNASPREQTKMTSVLRNAPLQSYPL